MGVGRSKSVEVMTSIDLDGANSTSAYAAPDMSNIYVQVVYESAAGSPVVTLYTSGDKTNWDTVAGYVSSALSAAGSFSWQLKEFSAPYYRVTVTSSGTAGTAVVTFNGNR